MSDLNQCNFIGRLGRDPEMRYAASGEAVCNFSIACGHKYKETETTEWVRCTAFGKLAEICGEYPRKGAQVFISGRMQTRKWTDKDGNDKFTTEIIVQTMQMLARPRDADDAPAPAGKAGKPATKPAPRQGSIADMDDDIPF